MMKESGQLSMKLLRLFFIASTIYYYIGIIYAKIMSPITYEGDFNFYWSTGIGVYAFIFGLIIMDCVEPEKYLLALTASAIIIGTLSIMLVSPNLITTVLWLIFVLDALYLIPQKFMES